MEELREYFLSGNFIVWIVAVVVLVLFLKFLKNAGKLLLLLIGVVIAGFLLQTFAPDIFDQLVGFVKGVWLDVNGSTER